MSQFYVSQTGSGGSSKREKLLVYQSDEILKGKKEVVIEHAGRTYRLLVTKSGKLILNK